MPGIFDRTKREKDDRLCFVMMPFEPAFDAIFRVIERSCKDHNLVCVRADSDTKPGKISEKIYQYIFSAGIIIADTKFEFGKTAAGITLADEVLTPDSSRFWPAELYSPGMSQQSFDKQYVRDYLEEIRWNKQPPAPALPAEVARKTSEKYVEAYRKLTGRDLDV